MRKLAPNIVKAIRLLGQDSRGRSFMMGRGISWLIAAFFYATFPLVLVQLALTTCFPRIFGNPILWLFVMTLVWSSSATIVYLILHELDKPISWDFFRFRSKLECIQLAQHLSETGHELEESGQFPAAVRMYLAACDIKTKHLGVNDIETIIQRLDLCRTMALVGQLQDSRTNLELAIASLRVVKDSELLRSALESYADVLSQLNQKAEAEIVYKELRTM